MKSVTPEEAYHAILPIVGPQGILIGSDMARYESGERYGNGSAICVVRPATLEQIQEVVRWCVSRGVQIVPQGANSGLVGASTPDESGNQLLLSTSRLNTHCEIDVANRSVCVDAGVTLSTLNEKLASHGLWFPIDLGSDPTVGGMISANTGGTRLIRYGDVRHNLLSLEVVLMSPPGEVLQLGRALRKDNTGPDLKQLFVGTSGSGFIVTRATFEVQVQPKQSATALVVPRSDDAVIHLLQALEFELGDFLAAFEGMSGAAMQAALSHVPGARNPFAPQSVPEYALLIELEATSGSSYTGLDLQETLNNFLQDHFEKTVVDAYLGDDRALWKLRHSLSEGARGIGKTIGFDVSVPRARVMEFCRSAREIVAEGFPNLIVMDFGHIADGGVHFNICWPADAPSPYDPKIVKNLRDQVYEMVVKEFRGSFSAEHGVGPINIDYYNKYVGTELKNLSSGIRKIIDPMKLCGAVDFGPSA